MLKSMSFRTTLVAIACAISMSAHAMADTPKKVDIPAGDLRQALPQLSKTYGADLVYRPEQVAGLTTHGVHGELTTKQAVSLLLEGTPLELRTDPSGAMLIAPAHPLSLGQGERSGSHDPPEGADSSKSSSRDGLRLAQVDQGQTSSPSTVEKKDEQASKKKPVVLEEVIVMGSRIPTVVGQQVQPVRSYTRDDIEHGGQTTIADFLNNLPDVSISNSVSNLAAPRPGAETVGLHGLPIGTTFVLLNGRRVQTSTLGFFDLSNIPVSAVERVEVLPVGASAIYGADALAGAINIILRQNINGLEASGTLGHAAGINDADANIAWGKSWDRGAISLLATYQDHGELIRSQRAATSSINFPANAPSAFYLNDVCSPGNVYSLDGQNLPGLSSPRAGIPAGISGTPTTQQFVATAGQVNQCNNDRLFDLITPSRREGALMSAHYQIAESMDLFSEVTLTHERLQASQDLMIKASHATLSANNPYNPFGKAVGVSFAYPGIQRSWGESGSFIRPLIGIRGSLFSDWHYEANAYLSRDRFDRDIPLGIGGAVRSALNSSGSATALNPFTTMAPGPAQLLQSLVTSAPLLDILYVNRLVDGQFMLRGPLFQLPAGPLQTVLGGEVGQERQEQQTLLGGAALQPPVNLSRQSYSVFTEARVPLLANYTYPKSGARLALTLAGRYDHTNDFGGKATWQSGFRWRPTELISLTGSFGVSYKAPRLSEIGGGVSSFSYQLADPLRGGQSTTATVVSGSNPNLNPETGKSTTLGVQYSSQAFEGLEASLTYFDINISNYIGQPPLLTVVANPNLYPGGVIRGPPTTQDQQQGFPGPLIQVNDLYYNFGDLHAAGFDADVRYVIHTSAGEFAPSLAVANIYRWQSALVPGAPSVSGVGQAIGYTGVGFAPRWKGTAAIDWKQGPLSANLSGRYLGRYRDYQDLVRNSNELGSSWKFDFSLRYEAGRALAGSNPWLAGTYLALGVVDLFDKAPPFSYYLLPFDIAEYDPRGRYIRIQLGITWGQR